MLGSHVAERGPRVFAQNMSEPKILVMCGIIVSIHGLVMAMTLTLYFGLEVRLGR
jgi:hypothetical protein